MPLELFKRIVDGLAADGIVVRSLKLWKDGEPLLNPDLPRFVRYAKDAGVAQEIRVNTNGTLLDRMARELIDAGLDYLLVSYVSPDERVYRDYTGSAAQAKVAENVAEFRRLRGNSPSPTIAAKICRFPAVSDEDVASFVSLFDGVADEVIVHEEPINWDDSFDSDLTLGGGRSERPVKRACPYPWYELNVNANGEVSVCPVDWSHGTIVGDVHEQTISEIWQGEPLARLRMMFAQRRFDAHPVCGKCTYYLAHEDDIDGFVLGGRSDVGQEPG